MMAFAGDAGKSRPDGYNAAAMRFPAAIFFNLLAPGAGLILLGRSWTGLITVLLFAVCGELAVCGVLVSPAGIPGSVTTIAGALAGGTWLLGQWMLYDRIRTLRNPSLVNELAALRGEAAAAVARGDMAEARGLLRLALDLDPDSIPTLRQWAEISTLLGRFREARRAWKHVARTGDAQTVREAVRALEKLPGRS